MIKSIVRSYFSKFCAGLMCSYLLGACTPDPVPEVFVNSVEVDVVPGANRNTAVAMDFVIVYESALLDNILKLSASSYFAQKEQLMRDNPQNLQIMGWEVVPGQVVPPRDVTFAQPIPLGGVFFANYLSPGDHRIRIGPQTVVKVVLGAEDLSLSGQ